MSSIIKRKEINMSVIPIPFSKKSIYVKAIILKLKRENRFYINDYEVVISIDDFFEELLDLIREERKGRQGVNSE